MFVYTPPFSFSPPKFRRGIKLADNRSDLRRGGRTLGGPAHPPLVLSWFNGRSGLRIDPCQICCPLLVRTQILLLVVVETADTKKPTFGSAKTFVSTKNRQTFAKRWFVSALYLRFGMF